MGKDSPSAPPPPDYVAAANATAAGNLDAARAAAAANRVNQVTPYGSLTYTKAPDGFNQQGFDTAMADYQRQMASYTQAQQAEGVAPGGFLPGWGSGSGVMGQNGFLPTPVAPDRKNFVISSPDDGWTATQSLSPAQQALLDQQNKTSLGLSGLADRGLGYVDKALSSSITEADLPASMVNAGQTGQDALMARYQPQIDQSRKALEAQLANQGIGQGSEAYKNAFRQQDQSENDLRSQAALHGIEVGQNAQNQQLQLKTALQNQPLNILNAVRTGAQVTNPTFTSVPQQATTAGPDLMGATGQQNQYNMGLYNSGVASANSGNSAAIGGIATVAAAMF